MSQNSRLANEKSPYLLRRVTDPIDWYPWGEEALQKARELDCPIFLSIGSATSHFCHRMGKETFTDEAVSTILNRAFVSIVIDREELPAIDRMYMEFAGALMGLHESYPLNLFLTSDCKPFYATSYVPTKTGSSMMGFYEIISHIEKVIVSEEKTFMYEEAERLAQIFEAREKLYEKGFLSDELLETFMKGLFEVCDPVFGGWKKFPKFPLSYPLNFILTESVLKDDQRGVYFVELTLDKMMCGGIHDLVGGGFFKATRDVLWQEPDFEKTLYDNALLARTYLDAFCYFQKEEYLEIGRGALDFLLTELANEEGGFYSAVDSDLDGEEGKRYLFKKEDLSTFDPVVLKSLSFIRGLPITSGSKDEKMAKEVLLKERQKRANPFIDNKILTSWNGLAIDALAKGGTVLGDSKYTKSSLKAIQFIKHHLFIENTLFHRYSNGDVKFIGGFEDYAFLIKASLTLFECGEGQEYLVFAKELTERVEELFSTKSDLYYETEEGLTPLFRQSGGKDTSLPSASGVHAENLMRLYLITSEEVYRERAQKILSSCFGAFIERSELSCYLGLALSLFLDKKSLVLEISGFSKEEVLPILKQFYLPHAIFVWKEEGAKEITPILAKKRGKPLLSVEELVEFLAENKAPMNP